MILQLENVGMNYSEVGWVFRGLSWNLRAGQSAVWVGPSGSGKTTLLRLLAGLEQPSEGQVQVHSKELGMLFQKNALFDSLTVEENLLFPLRERLGVTGDAGRERALASLESVGLQGTQALFPADLSGGMQKRLGIARALIVEPEVIFYDDPTAGLDPITSRSIASLLRELSRKGRNGKPVTSVMVTNDVDRALEMGDEIQLLAQGRWIRGGTPAEIRAHHDPSIRQFFSGSQEGPLTSMLSEGEP